MRALRVQRGYGNRVWGSVVSASGVGSWREFGILLMILFRTVNSGKCSIFLVMGNAEFISSTVGPVLVAART